MRIKHYNKSSSSWDKEKSCSTTEYTTNLTQIVECCECGKKLRYGEAYTSTDWFTVEGLCGVPECEECYAKHNWQKEK